MAGQPEALDRTADDLRLGQPVADPVAHHEPVHHEVDVVRLARVEPRVVADLGQHAVDPRPEEPGLPDLLENLLVLPFPAAHQGREEEAHKELDRAYADLGRKVKLDGFRPGKIPKRILQQRFRDQVLEDVKSRVMDRIRPKEPFGSGAASSHL